MGIDCQQNPGLVKNWALGQRGVWVGLLACFEFKCGEISVVNGAPSTFLVHYYGWLCFVYLSHLAKEIFSGGWIWGQRG
jgi:hypothetical protein